MSFSSLGLSEKVLAAVEAAGYTEPTAIQAEAIPYVLQKRDVLGLAQTGTGKTASFTLPMLTLLEKGRARARMPRTLILEPTRELAAQVEENFNKYGVNHKLNVALLIGGTSFGDQDKKLDRGVDVLIATPGRLLDHTERGKLMLQGVEILVIDEADRMLDMGFIPDIERICKLIPFTRQTLFFSATMPPEIQRLVDTFLHAPARVEVARASSTAETVKQNIVASDSKDAAKRETLRGLIDEAGDALTNAIIFCNRKRDVQTVFRSLQRHGYSVGALHGDMDQRSRMATLDQYRNGDLKLLVASDVAARGLDIPAVSHVFNYDIPTHAEDYVHRIGRTGRAGRSGAALSIITPNDQKYLAGIEKLIEKPIEWLGDPVDFDAEGDRGDRRKSGRGRSRGAAADKAGSGDKAEKTSSARKAPEKKAQDKKPVEQAVEASEQPGGGGDKQPRGNRGENGGRRTRQSAQGSANAGEPRNNRRNDNKSGRRRGQDRDDEPVIGLGDHVPAFLLRDPRATKKTG
ncbi:MAG: DEAD/DEAH box helicase [Stappia sp.]|uniref:DEAD/DEAH box helicase n=1 Tax=Stappia sp. TaxID=1870903 RepID=UPI000C5A46F4|nr:DEAD/DEAH box helicase [Stappia sp.]MAA98394.1 DEAD/DEAH box helicase [Stappia sp.]MBM21709.1 DEAD/DEAH box helicase [Stappia sp.]